MAYVPVASLAAPRIDGRKIPPRPQAEPDDASELEDRAISHPEASDRRKKHRYDNAERRQDCDDAYARREEEEDREQ